MRIITDVLSVCLVALMADMVASFPPHHNAPAPPGPGPVCHCPLIPEPPNPKPCGLDEKCPQYFVESCGFDRYQGLIMVFSGDCYMENYNCRTGSHFEIIPLFFCKPVPANSTIND